MASAGDVVGWWSLIWKGGSFEVCFRPAGTFFCPKFQESAKWEERDGVIFIDWKKFGQYELTLDSETRTMAGNRIPKNEANENNWRKAEFLRPLSDLEAMLIGDGAGTEWDFEWSGGSFPVEFKADGYNHFKCSTFPAHAHWSLNDDKIFINWAEYGKYELTADMAASTLSGCAVGGDPATDWRKAKLLRSLTSQATESCSEHH
mmetsp:Transcript_35135/g.93663  ORF Transcript_35135/g.93663 Transcript_35135/m.93663 type:complete len:204 (-) Transcript_35135:124-735(-)